MALKSRGTRFRRREFLKKIAVGGSLAVAAENAKAQGTPAPPSGPSSPVGRSEQASVAARVQYPRKFSGRNLKMIAFPLGGLGTGSISLGGRGQLRDWEIFNRPDKGNSPNYCFAAIWAEARGRKSMARVLEARLEPPYEGESGLGADNVPGLPRLQSATFVGAYPFARITFQDEKLPVGAMLEAFNPLVPLDVEASGWPVAILRYTFKNSGQTPAKVGLAFSLENQVGKEGRQSAFREEEGVAGLYMDNPFLSPSDPLKGSMVLGVLGAAKESVSYLRGWKRAQWWDGALMFWDDFRADGALTSDTTAVSPVGSLAVTQSVPAGGEASATVLLAWHFPNRTPVRCGWPAPEGDEKTVVGNYYTARFSDAWDVARQVARELPALEARTRRFAETAENSTLPPAVLDAALSNLSTLRTNTAFITPDAEFHGFEGCNNQNGCCHGSCTHVWNYEQATAFVFPRLARSLRESEFLRNTEERGLMGFRSYLPDGKKIWDRAAADGQMGCLMKLYRDWQFSGDTEWLKKIWPQAKRALEFAWVQGGWDGDRDGVAEGVQHNTYDVEFYGPNPLTGVWYLGALRAGEEMAQALGDETGAKEYRRLFDNGKQWFDANLFNGEYYIQKVQGRTKDQVAEGLLVGMGAADPKAPDYQMGEACLVDQLLGQYMAHVAGLGYLLDEGHVKKTLQSIFRYNYKSDLSEHEAVQRIYAVNDEGGVLVATYPSGKRPEIPFPYFAEVWTGLEYQFAAHLIFEGMVEEAVQVAETARRRHDGERRNPWNEPECGHHYARAMSSWAMVPAISGFHYSGVSKELTLAPRVRRQNFRSFWSVPSGWGSFVHSNNPSGQRAEIRTVEGAITIAKLGLEGNGKNGAKVVAKLGSETIGAKLSKQGTRRLITFEREVQVVPEHPLSVTVKAAAGAT